MTDKKVVVFAAYCCILVTVVVQWLKANISATRYKLSISINVRKYGRRSIGSS